jgi:hypothetical protein
MPPGPVQIIFAVPCFAVVAHGKWLIRRSPPYMPWKSGSAVRALRVERAFVRILMTTAAFVGLSFLITGIRDL